MSTFTYDEVKELLLAERRRAVDIAYEFKKDNDESFKNKTAAGSKVAFISKEIAEECRFIGNSISGLTGLSHAVGETTETLIIKQLDKYVNDRKLSGTYDDSQTPAERLRNCLSPFINLVELLSNDNDILQDSEIQLMISQTIEICKNSKQNVKSYLSDIEQFYSK